MCDREPEDHADGAGSGTPARSSTHAEQEMRLLEYLDGRLTAAEAKELEKHLASCADCRELQHKWQQLDSKLMRPQPATLSPDFEARLWLRIKNESVIDTAAGPERTLEVEVQASWPGIGHWFLRSQLFRLFDGVGLAAAAALGCYLFYKLLAKLPAVSTGAVGGRLQAWAWLIGTMLGLLIACGGLALASKRRVSRWLAVL